MLRHSGDGTTTFGGLWLAWTCNEGYFAKMAPCHVIWRRKVTKQDVSGELAGGVSWSWRNSLLGWFSMRRFIIGEGWRKGAWGASVIAFLWNTTGLETSERDGAIVCYSQACGRKRGVHEERGVWAHFWSDESPALSFEPGARCADAKARLCWLSEKLEGSLEGLEFEERKFWTEVTAEAPYPDMQQWITPGAVWEGGERGEVLPTALKSIKRTQPPPQPAGWHRCDDDTLARWESDCFRFPPYHYLSRFLFWEGSKWRLANSREKEMLLGYGFDHTVLCYSASKIKQSKQKFEDERLSLLGDSFSIYSFCIVAAALCKNFLPSTKLSAFGKSYGDGSGYGGSHSHEVWTQTWSFIWGLERFGTFYPQRAQ